MNRILLHGKLKKLDRSAQMALLLSLGFNQGDAEDFIAHYNAFRKGLKPKQAAEKFTDSEFWKRVIDKYEVESEMSAMQPGVSPVPEGSRVLRALPEICMEAGDPACTKEISDGPTAIKGILPELREGISRDPPK